MLTDDVAHARALGLPPSCVSTPPSFAAVRAGFPAHGGATGLGAARAGRHRQRQPRGTGRRQDGRPPVIEQARRILALANHPAADQP
ncbi:hypothetical protein ACU4HD_34770 [Cupriavidus basilensis]